MAAVVNRWPSTDETLSGSNLQNEHLFDMLDTQSVNPIGWLRGKNRKLGGAL